MDALTALRAQFEKQEKVVAKDKADKAEASAAAKKATVVEKKEKAPKADSTSASTLKSLSGVGPAMEKRMNALGVNSLADLTALTEDKIASMVAEDAKNFCGTMEQMDSRILFIVNFFKSIQKSLASAGLFFFMK